MYQGMVVFICLFWGKCFICFILRQNEFHNSFMILLNLFLSYIYLLYIVIDFNFAKILWLYEVLDIMDLFTLISFTADLLFILSDFSKEVSMVAMLITGAVGLV